MFILSYQYFWWQWWRFGNAIYESHCSKNGLKNVTAASVHFLCSSYNFKENWICIDTSIFTAQLLLPICLSFIAIDIFHRVFITRHPIHFTLKLSSGLFFVIPWPCVFSWFSIAHLWSCDPPPLYICIKLYFCPLLSCKLYPILYFWFPSDHFV